MSSRKSIREDVEAIAAVYDLKGKTSLPIRVRCAASTLVNEARKEGSGFSCPDKGVRGGAKPPVFFGLHEVIAIGGNSPP